MPGQSGDVAARPMAPPQPREGTVESSPRRAASLGRPPLPHFPKAVRHLREAFVGVLGCLRGVTYPIYHVSLWEEGPGDPPLCFLDGELVYNGLVPDTKKPLLHTSIEGDEHSLWLEAPRGAVLECMRQRGGRRLFQAEVSLGEEKIGKNASGLDSKHVSPLKMKATKSIVDRGLLRELRRTSKAKERRKTGQGRFVLDFSLLVAAPGVECRVGEDVILEFKDGDCSTPENSAGVARVFDHERLPPMRWKVHFFAEPEETVTCSWPTGDLKASRMVWKDRYEDATLCQRRDLGLFKFRVQRSKKIEGGEKE